MAYVSQTVFVVNGSRLSVSVCTFNGSRLSVSLLAPFRLRFLSGKIEGGHRHQNLLNMQWNLAYKPWAYITSGFEGACYRGGGGWGTGGGVSYNRDEE